MKTPEIPNTVLVVIDLQEAFRAAISDFPEIASRTATAVRGFLTLGAPIIVTEQYPKGLGKTAEEILFSLPDDFEFIEKSTFSAYREPTFVARLKATGATDVVLCGVETHICVNQTAHDLIAAGFQVHLLTDAVASRFSNDRETALTKMFSAGAIPATVEMTLFELLADSKHPKFREIQSLIK